jgi:hypothetical protein
MTWPFAPIPLKLKFGKMTIRVGVITINADSNSDAILTILLLIVSFLFQGHQILRNIQKGRGRNASYLAPPAQIPASGTTALGSYLG